MQNPIHLYDLGYPTAVRCCLGFHEDTLVQAEVPLGWHHGQRGGILIPDLMVAFEVNIADVIARRGYSIEEQGKAPELVLEIASPSAGRQDEERKRAGYEEYGVREYWRFDPSGGEYHRQSLAGDVLIDGTSQGIAIEETHPGLFWGRSAVLGLSICWEYGHLRWWDPAAQRYLETHDQTTERADAAEDRAAAAEARVQELEEEIHRRQQT